jgi:hypothetical protein
VSIATGPSSADVAPISGVRWMGVPLAIGLGSRVFSVLLVSALGVLERGTLDRGLSMWDAQWYLRIAAQGYHAGVGPGARDYAFFPLWPMVIRALSAVSPAAIDTTAVIAANVFFIGAMVVVWRLFAVRFGRGLATTACVLLAFSPAAYVFSLAYAESLFLALAAFQFVLPAASLWRGPLAALASLARLPGLAIGLAAFDQALRSAGRVRRGAAVAAAGAALGFAAWWLFIAWLTGNPLGYLTGSSAWVRGNPIYDLARVVRHDTLRSAAWLGFGAAVVLGSALLYRRDRELAVYSAGVLAIAAIPIVFGGKLYSEARYVVLAFPAFAGLADHLGTRGRWLLLVLFAVGQVVFASWTLALSGSKPP